MSLFSETGFDREVSLLIILRRANAIKIMCNEQ